MKSFLTLFLVALAGVLILFAADLAKAQTAAKKSPKKKVRRAFVPITDNPALPRVLLIGDSISIGYTLPVRAALKGKANVHRPPENCGPTSRGVEKIDAWLGKGRWDVIHFNFGLHDLKLIDGKHQVALKDYEKNLRAIVKRLKETGAVLIWCSTTPVPKTSNPPRHNEDVLAYNAVAQKIMEENRIPTDDLYAFALPQLEKIQLPSNVHFSGKGYRVLTGRVAKEIGKALKQRQETKVR
ncbi:MAG: SGNH/GDSL hydrolase family protein [Pirellulales bacterium]|nr:SGNH/GDSL hydrolase family protein [Pirellulales bacterium]